MTSTAVCAESTIRRRLVAGRPVLLAALSALAVLWPSVGAASADGVTSVRRADLEALASRQVSAEAAPVRQVAGVTTAQFQVTLADLGFIADVVMWGAQAGTRLRIPLPHSGVPGGRLVLNLDVSPILHPSATVQVTINGRPASAFTVAQLRDNRTIEVPVPLTAQSFLDIDISGTLFSEMERCVQEHDMSLWMILTRDSRLISERSLPAASVADFLSVPGGIVAVQGRWDTPADRDSSIALFSTVQHALRNGGSRVMLAEDAASAAPTGQEQQRTIVLGRDGDPLLRLDGAVLSVSPQQPALDALTADSARVLLSGQTVPGAEHVAATPNPTWSASFGPVASYRRELSTLGLGSGERVGTGVLATPIRFSVADLGGWPADLMLDLDTHFDQVSLSSLERALLRVRLNGTLVETTDLRGASSFQRLIPLPAAALQPSNQLDIDFVYAPETGNCAGAPVTFTGQISGGSGLTWSSYGQERGVLPEVIGSLDQADLVLMDDSPEMARTAARLVGGLSRLTPWPVIPQMVTTAVLGQRRSGATTLVLGGSGDTLKPLGLPVSAGPTVDIVDGRTDMVILRGNADRPIVAVQYLPGSAPALAIQVTPGADPRLIDGVIRELVDPSRFFGWSGNVVLGVPGDLVSLDLNGSALRARQASVWDWRVLLARYRWILAAVAIVVVLAGCWMTYRRLGKQRAVPALSAAPGT